MKQSSQKSSPKKMKGIVADSMSLNIPYRFNSSQTRLIAIGAAILGILAGLFYIIPMESIAGVFGFPFDDAWIPLTFAKNLREFGAYSYFQNEMITSGSTSPLYVFLLAILGFVSANEFFLSFSIGILAFSVTAVFLFRLGIFLFPEEQWLAAIVVISFLVFPLTHSAAVSGMSTMLFTALITASMYYYFDKKFSVSFALLGFSLWVRPDALTLMIAAGLHILYHSVFVKASAKSSSPKGEESPERKSLFAGIGLFILLLTGYFVFNLALSGSIFPNSVGAKLAYFKGVTGPSYLSSVFSFYTTSMASVFFVFAFIGLILLFLDFYRRQPTPLLMSAAYIIGSVIAYGLFLPFLYDNGRYLVPTIPFFLLLGVYGVRQTSSLLLKLMPIPAMRKVGNALTFGVFVVAVIVGIAGLGKTRNEHYKAIQYLHNRQVAAANWIHENTPKSSVVATHTIGAIGYYGQRKLIDMTGIVTPAIIPSIGNLLELETYLKGGRTEYIATLRERFEVVNVNPEFTSDIKTPEIMEVFKYIPGRTHIMAQRATVLNAQAAGFMQSRMDQQALQILQQSYQLDPVSVRTNTLLGVCILNLGDTTNATSFLKQSLLLQPDYAPAMVPLGDIYINKKDYLNAITVLETAVKLNPAMTSAQKSYEVALQKHYEDSLRALGWRAIQFTQ